MKSEKKEKIKTEKRETKSFFLLAWPFLITSAIAIMGTSDIKLAAILLICAIVGFVTLKQFVDDFYNVR